MTGASASMSPRLRAYGLALAALWVLQIAGRLILFGTADTGAGMLPVIMHVSLALSNICLLALFLAVLAEIPWLEGPRAFLAAIAAGVLHAAFTIFDIYQSIFINLTGRPGPTFMIFNQPVLALSLLDNAGISPLVVQAAVVALFAVFILLYLPVRKLLLRVPLALALGRLRLGPLAVPGFIFLSLGVLNTTFLLKWASPAVRAGMKEATQPQWQIAPPAMLAAAAKPPPRKAKGTGEAPQARPVVLIVVDALRSDRMGVYAPALGNTPFLSGLQAQGKLRRFDAYSTCTFSFCGIMSIMASRSWNDFDARPETLIDRLAQHGYDAHLVLAGEHSNFGGLTGMLGGPIASLTDQPPRSQPDDRAALAALARLPVGDPARTFLYLHLMSTHAGTFIEPRFRATPEDTGRIGAYLFTPGRKTRYQRIYDLRVRQVDEVIRRAFALLESKGMLKDALVVITSDHGQRTSEGGLLYHGGEADPPTLKIPLLIYDARGGTYAGAAPASQIDVAPTVAQAAGLAASPGWKGVALQQGAKRAAVPVGTSQSTGMVVARGGEALLYLCNRRSGEERLVEMRGGRRLPSNAITPALRTLHGEVAAPVREAGCRRLNRPG
jgi:glucan phosphoethanolaminetransferase (alkaline phosphatase superfamily)